MIIAIDFDGTMHTGKWPEIGSPVPYLADMMQKLAADGHKLIIWTCREGQPQTDMVNWLLAHDIPFHSVNDHIPGSWEMYGNKSRKVYAHVYIDDAQVGDLPMWPDIYRYVSEKELKFKEQGRWKQ